MRRRFRRSYDGADRSITMTEPLTPEALYQTLRTEAVHLAGDLTALGQRAAVYYHLYDDSNGNNVFPLIAAHGALWGGQYFRKGLAASRWLSWQYFYSRSTRAVRMAAVNALANAFRDINRRVCVEAYTAYHLTRELGSGRFTREQVPAPLLEGLLHCHEARRLGVKLSASERARLFEAFFLWEQHSIVAPAVTAAFAAFEWPVVKALALTPKIRFSYFPGSLCLPFQDFSDKAERIEKGLDAYELAERVGLKGVEAALRRYGALPEAFFDDPARHFQHIKCGFCETGGEATYSRSMSWTPAAS